MAFPATKLFAKIVVVPVVVDVVVVVVDVSEDFDVERLRPEQDIR